MLKRSTGFLKTLLGQNRTWKSAQVINEAFLPPQRSEWINRAAKAWALPCMGSSVWGEEGSCHMDRANTISYLTLGANTGAVCRETDVHAAVGLCVCKWSLKLQLNQKRIPYGNWCTGPSPFSSILLTSIVSRAFHSVPTTGNSIRDKKGPWQRKDQCLWDQMVKT